jgi:hypothetical protein
VGLKSRDLGVRGVHASAARQDTEEHDTYKPIINSLEQYYYALTTEHVIPAILQVHIHVLRVAHK